MGGEGFNTLQFVAVWLVLHTIVTSGRAQVGVLNKFGPGMESEIWRNGKSGFEHVFF
jgi:hypothetical protein